MVRERLPFVGTKIGSMPPDNNCWRIWTRPAVRSISVQRRPASSDLRIPESRATVHRAADCGPAAFATLRNVAASSADQQFLSAADCSGPRGLFETNDASFRASKRLFTAAFSALLRTVKIFSSVAGARLHFDARNASM